MPDNAPAGSPAPNDGGDGGGTPPAPAPDPNDLGTEMSAEDEAAFVDRQLGITDSGAPFAVKPGEGTPEGGGDGNKIDEKAKPEPGATPPAPAGDNPGANPPNPDDPKPAEDAGKTADKDKPLPAKEDEQTPQAAATPQEIDTTDLWVELEDANGKTFKIGVNDPLPEELVFKNDAQLAEFTEARMEMKGALREREAERDRAQAEAEAKENSQKTETEQLAAWDAEIQDLVAAGLIEAPKAKPGDKDFMQDASVQKIDAVFKFMASQNVERKKEGKQPINSFGTAYTLWANDQAKKAEEEAQKKSNQTAKERGALVGSGSSSSAGGGNDGLYTQGSAGSIHDLDFSDLV